MKTRITLLAMFASLSIIAQNNPTESSASQNINEPHHGFQYALYLGGSGGSINAKVDGIGTVKFTGPTIHLGMHAGYAYRNWAAGIAVQYGSLSIHSLKLNGTDVNSEYMKYMDHVSTGLYVTRYFMPINMYITAEAGIGTFSSTDAAGNTIGDSDLGFGWNIRVGKEFLIGKKKKSGLGAYVQLNGLQCHDQAPNANDVYTYVGPGIGLNYSFH